MKKIILVSLLIPIASHAMLARYLLIPSFQVRVQSMCMKSSTQKYQPHLEIATHFKEKNKWVHQLHKKLVDTPNDDEIIFQSLERPSLSILKHIAVARDSNEKSGQHFYFSFQYGEINKNLYEKRIGQLHKEKEYIEDIHDILFENRRFITDLKHELSQHIRNDLTDID